MSNVIQKIQYKLSAVGALFLSFVLPLFASAQPTGTFGSTQANSSNDVTDILEKILNLINTLVPVLIAVIFLFLIVEGVRYVVVQDDGAKTSARNGMIKAFIVLLVVLSVWGIIALIANFAGIGVGGDISNSGAVPSADFQI